MTYRCTHCNSSNIEQIAESKYKCKDCNQDFVLKKHVNKDDESNLGSRDRIHKDHRSGKL
jgi:DNA-directed RNA polymerase subunit RPC12/RpoP